MIKTLVLLLVCTSAISQQNEYGKIIKDTMFLNNGAKFVVGEKVKLGYGSNGAKGFEFIYLSPYSIGGPIKLPSNWANLTMVVKDFKSFKNKKVGDRFYLVLNGGNLSPYWCDVIAAMDQGELVVTGINDKKPGTAAAASLADELKKLKDLLDSGALTQDEYASAKKKLLEQ